MAYADLNALLARAGRLAGAWTDETDPDLSDLEVFLGNVAAEIDAELLSRSITVPINDQAAAALAGMNADGALVLAIEGTFVGTRSEEVTNILTGARTRYQAALDAMRNGTHTVVRWLESTTAASLGASSFWDTEMDDYGVVEVPPEWINNPAIAPAVFRNEKG